MQNETSFPDLIHSKLHRPPVSRRVIARPRLLTEMQRGLSVPFTLVCAPAGFGKTTLVSSWLEGLSEADHASPEPIRTAWLTLDEGDSDVVVFLRYLVTAVCMAFPGACPYTLSLLRVSVPPTAKAMTSALINDLSDLPARLVLVLEDYHAISDGAVHDLIHEMVRYWPQQVHLVLISRSTPPLPLASLRAKGQITEIRSHDLRFTGEESAEFLAESVPVSMSDSALALLQQRTEGWAAGLQLAALSLANTKDAESAVRELEGTDANIADYLVSEVLTQQPQAIQEFLLKTSIFSRFCVSLCESVLKTEHDACDSRACMEWLEQANLFITPLDHAREWYRYHALFREVLQRRLLSQLRPEQVAELHRRSAHWFALNGSMDEALGHAVTAPDYDLAGTLMEAALPAVLNREDRLTLERWLHLLPDEFVENRPVMLMIEAWVMEFSWQIEAQATVLERIELLLNNAPPASRSPETLPSFRGQLAVLKAQAAYFANQPAKTMDYCHEALANLPATWLFVRGGAYMYLGLAMQASGQWHEAEQMLIALFESITDRSSSYAVRPLMTLCFTYLLNGQLEEVIQTAESMYAQASAAGLIINQCWAQHFLGVARYHQNNLTGARHHFESVVSRSHAAQMLTVRASMYGLVLCQQQIGDAEDAWHTVEQLRLFDLQARGAEAKNTRSLRARLDLMQGGTAQALQWARSSHAHATDHPLLWLEEPSITQARILLAEGDEAENEVVLDLLESVYEIAQRTFNIPAQIEVLCLRSVALASPPNTRLGQALATLEKAVALAQPGEFIRFFVELGLPMQTMLGILAKREKPTSFVVRLLNAFQDPNSAEQSSHFNTHQRAETRLPVAQLTARELEILALMRQRMTNDEIAHRLVISPKTVKRHISNIFAKLHVNRRWDAVATAETLGMFPPV